MKKKSLFIFVFLIIFNYVGSFFLVYENFNINNIYINNISYADSSSSIRDRYFKNPRKMYKQYFSAICSNLGLKIEKGKLDEVYENFESSISDDKYDEFIDNSKEFFVRSMFKGKKSIEKLVSENILSDNELFQSLFKKDLELVYNFVNKAYYNYSVGDIFSGSNYYRADDESIKVEVANTKVFNINFKDELVGSSKIFHSYPEENDYYSDELGGNAPTITFQKDYLNKNGQLYSFLDEFDGIQFKAFMTNVKVFERIIEAQRRYTFNDDKEEFRSVLNDLKMNVNYLGITHNRGFSLGNNKNIVINNGNSSSGTALTYISSDNLGFNIIDRLPLKVVYFHIYYFRDETLLFDTYEPLLCNYPIEQKDINRFLKDEDFLRDLFYYIKSAGVNDNEVLDSNNKVLNNNYFTKIDNRTFNNITNNNFYNTYINDNRVTNITNNDITYNIYNVDGDLEDRIVKLIDEITSNNEFLNDYLDYIYGDLNKKYDSLMFAIDDLNNDIVLGNKEILNKLDTLEIDYSKINNMIEEYNNKLLNDISKMLSNKLSILSSKIDSIDSNVRTIKSKQATYYSSLNNEMRLIKRKIDELKSSPGSGDSNYDDRFNSIDDNLNELKEDFNSKFDNLNNKIDDISFLSDSLADKDKKSLKDNIFSFFDLFKKIKEFFTNFFTITEEINVDSFKEIDFKDKFPFCIPYDFANIFNSLTSEPKIPIFTFEFLGQKVVFNFANFESLGIIIKNFSFLFFIVFLMIKTFDKLGG